MSLKKTALVIQSFSLFNPFLSFAHPSSISQSCSSPSSSPSRRQYRRRRQYATVAHNELSSSEEEIQWPAIDDPRKLPSPYQIFNQKRSEPYSKSRFYELVKLYHPDRISHSEQQASTSSSHHCSHHDRLERYRLIISANSILSDPGKREAYDRYGYGWSDFREEDGSFPSRQRSDKYNTHHRWHQGASSQTRYHFDDDPMYNATWEDWERWYQRQNGEYKSASGRFWPSTFFSHTNPSRPVYVSNHVFISLIALLTGLAGISQATRLDSASKSRMERIEKVHLENGRLLQQARENGIAATDTLGGDKRERMRQWAQRHYDYEGDSSKRKEGEGTLDDG